MGDAPLVEVAEGAQQSIGHGQDLLDRQPARCPHALGEGLAREQLQQKIGLLPVVDLVAARQTGVL